MAQSDVFYSGCWSPKAGGFQTLSSPGGQRAAAVDTLLSNKRHLPHCTSCLIHHLSSSSEVFMIGRWWISGQRKVRVTRVRGDQIRRLNMNAWAGEPKKRRGWRERKKWDAAEILSVRRDKQKSERETQRDSFAQRVPSVPCMYGSSDSLFTWRKVSGASHTETLQNCSWFLCVSSPRRWEIRIAAAQVCLDQQSVVGVSGGECCVLICNGREIAARIYG